MGLGYLGLGILTFLPSLFGWVLIIILCFKMFGFLKKAHAALDLYFEKNNYAYRSASDYSYNNAQNTDNESEKQDDMTKAENEQPEYREWPEEKDGD